MTSCSFATGPTDASTDSRSGAEQIEIADLSDHIGHLARGRRADLIVLERLHKDPYESVCLAGRSSVELVVVDGHLIYARDDWFDQLAPDAVGEELWAWGRKMRLKAGVHLAAGVAGVGQHHFIAEIPETLSEIRAKLIARFAQLGPIFA